MSGTSLDGLDIAYVRFEKKEKWQFQILISETIPYSESWENSLRNSIFLSAENLLELHSEYGFYLGQKVLEFITKNKIENIDVISSHGHTVFHQPNKKFTTQIGDGRAIKLITKIPVVYDFRMQDVLMGGNGAPLVPIGDELLFENYDACLNIGGFSNISMNRNGKRIAFDISPVNIVINKLSQKLGFPFDKNGAIAKNANVNQEILSELNSLEFYHQEKPKSLGVEWCNTEIFPRLETLTTENAIATFTAHSAEQILNVFKKYNVENVLITGGGAYNQYLMELLSKNSNIQIIIPETKIIEFKEALIFAFMGVLRLNNEINVLSSATGSSHDHSSGIIA